MRLTNINAAWHSMREQGQRPLLSSLGVAVASLAIITLIAIATGVQKDLTSQVDELGVQTLFVLPGRIEAGTLNPNLGGQSFLKEEFAQQIRSLPDVRRVSMFTFAGGGIRAGKKEAYPMVVGTTSDWFAMSSTKLKFGKPWDGSNYAGSDAVIGAVASDDLFGPGVNPVGKSVEINKRSYRIVAVTEEKKESSGLLSMFSLQNVVFVPYHQLKALEPTMQTDRILIQGQLNAEPTSLVARIDKFLGSKLDRQQYSVLTQKDLLKLVHKLMGVLTWLVTGLTSIALFVGGVGILAIMTLAVSERTREIGIRRTTGARARDIFEQFLCESVFIAIFGGTIGLLASVLICTLLQRYTAIQPSITVSLIAMCYAFCLVVGATFGIFPAIAAARRSPVEAVRSE